jgi:asparagine synthase (glutamine-hydrolysing)
MCGINGIFAYQTCASSPDPAELIATRDHMRRRGPDGAGEWWSKGRRCALGHRRLSIQDLSDRALQPMVSDDGAQIVTFNGEIYNFPELRKTIEAAGRRLRTTSDTEALLHLYAMYGPEMVHHLRGMYAFAIWDQLREGLFLARDPYGIKPLYTANDGWTFRFASQVKALLAGGGVSRDPEPAGLVGFLLYGSVPEPFTLYREIRALPAGHSQWVDAAGPREPKCFANLATIVAEGARAPSPPSELGARVRAATLDSVRAHLLADVEVGVFLSAGIDSGAILGLMRDAGQSKVQTITLSYAEYANTTEDEGPLAAQVADLYGAKHILRRVDAQEFREDLPDILEAMDQPSIDGINTWFVSKAARESGLKVGLSGIGGDELFAGYPSFRDIPRWVNWLRATSLPGLGRTLRLVGSALAPALALREPKALALIEHGGVYPGAYLVRRGLFLPAELSEYMDKDLVRSGLSRLMPLQRLARSLKPDPGSAMGRVSVLESTQYLRNQLLRDADWAGMAHSLEIRAPLVDITTLQRLAGAIPALTRNAGKAALASAPLTPLPGSLVNRAKTGFGVPSWKFTSDDGEGLFAKKSQASRARALEILGIPPRNTLRPRVSEAA